MNNPINTINQQERKDKGLADLETGSEYYLSEMLQMNIDDFEEGEESSENDLLSLKDPFYVTCISVTFYQDILIEKLTDFFKSNSDYYKFCLKSLLKEDQELAKVYLILN